MKFKIIASLIVLVVLIVTAYLVYSNEEETLTPEQETTVEIQ